MDLMPLLLPQLVFAQAESAPAVESAPAAEATPAVDAAPTTETVPGQKVPPAGGQRPVAQPPMDYTQLLMPIVLIFGLYYFLILRPQQKDQSKREGMLKSLKKNDRVVTIGGIIGTVANTSPESDEVTLKVDDNTRMRFLRSSIQRVLTEPAGDNTSSGSGTSN